MAVYKSKGIVLRSIRYSEADRILDLYTRDAGLVSAIAKGIRRTKSRFGARLEPLSCVDFVAYHGRTLDTVTQAETLRSFHGVREDLARFETAAGMVGSVRALSGGDEADRRVFNLLYNALDTLETCDSGFETIEAALGMKLSILAGYAPQLDVCLVCGTDLDAALGAAALRPRPRRRPVPGMPTGDRRRVPARPRHPRKPENPGRIPHPSSASTVRAERERPQGSPLPRPGPRSRKHPGRSPTRRRRTQGMRSPEPGLSRDPLSWAVESSAGRQRPEPHDGVRNDFQRDRDRIIHAKAFRRLMHKTQVFISPDGDHFRTRLTHTLEMMQISRTIARSLSLNEDLAEAISLGHDLGHTPFGHTGEEALSLALAAHGRSFRHNEHSLRVVDHLERQGDGLNLTYEVRDGILNHTGKGYPSTREGEIVRVADRIAYVNHDVDDALRAGIISSHDLPRGPISVLGEQMSTRIDTLVRDMISNSKREW